MFADPKKVSGRRLRRRLKAGVSIGLALVAGAFLACKGGTVPEETSPTGPDARGRPATPDIEGDSGASAAAATASVDAATEAAAGDSASDSGAADASTALAIDGGKDGGPDARAPKVDKHEHRRGMPVRDNLLE